MSLYQLYYMLPLYIDPVARFHIRNGASLRKITYGANMSSNGTNTSGTFMINYIYPSDMKELDNARYNFINSNGNIPIHDDNLMFSKLE